MRVDEIARRMRAEVLEQGDEARAEILRVFAGDRISDLLNQASERTLLLTGAASAQLLRVAELMDVAALCLVGGVAVDDDLRAAARNLGLWLLRSPTGLFESCGRIYAFLPGGDGAS